MVWFLIVSLIDTDSIDPGERSRQVPVGKFLNLLKSFSTSIL